VIYTCEPSARSILPVRSVSPDPFSNRICFRCCILDRERDTRTSSPRGLRCGPRPPLDDGNGDGCRTICREIRSVQGAANNGDVIGGGAGPGYSASPAESHSKQGGWNGGGPPPRLSSWRQPLFHPQHHPRTESFQWAARSERGAAQPPSDGRNHHHQRPTWSANHSPSTKSPIAAASFFDSTSTSLLGAQTTGKDGLSQHIYQRALHQEQLSGCRQWPRIAVQLVHLRPMGPVLGAGAADERLPGQLGQGEHIEGRVHRR